MNEKSNPLFSLHGKATQSIRINDPEGKDPTSTDSIAFKTMRLLRSAAPQRAYTHHGWEVHPAHDSWHMRGFRWMVFETGEDTSCCRVSSLSEARAMIDESIVE